MLMQTDPFRDLDTLFSRLSNRQPNTSGVMPMDAFRRGSDVWVHIDLPGVKAEALDITVEDNGRGFDAAKIAHTGGIDPNVEGVGLKNIRSRVAFLNGELDISSRPGEGTLIALYIPLKQLSN